MPEYMYLIWSFEHQQWWAPNEQGYTYDLLNAGRYTAEQAGRIVTNSVMAEEVAILENLAFQLGEPTVKSLWA